MSAFAAGPDRGWRARGTLALLLLLALVAVVVDRSVSEPAAGASEREVALTAGRTTCAALGLGSEDQVIASSVGHVAGEEPDERATASLVLEQPGQRRSLTAPDTGGAAVASIVVGQDAPATLTARWEHTPLLLSRRWDVSSSARVPGAVEGPCPGRASDRWVVPGLVTAGGASAELHLANPTAAAAAVGVTFTTPGGPLAPTRLANLVVPANGSTVVDLNQFVPEEADLGVIVDARVGMVVVEAVLTLEAAVGGVDGRSLVVAHDEAAEVWTLPYVRAQEGESAWVWVTNPGDEPTDVRLVLHTAGGPVVPPAAGVTLAPGTTERIDLRGALADVGAAGVTVRASEGTSIVASGAMLRAVEEDPVGSGVAVLEAGVAGSGPHASTSAVGGSGRAVSAFVTNPGEVDATVTVRVVGRNALTPRLVSNEFVVPAGTMVTFGLDDLLPLEGGHAVLVDVVEGVAVAGVVSTSLDGPLELTATLARPFPTRATAALLPTVRDRTLLHPIGPLGGTGDAGGEGSDDPAVDGEPDEPGDDVAEDGEPQEQDTAP